MNARRLNDAGIELFQSWLIQAKSGQASDVPAELLQDPNISSEIEPTIPIKNIKFQNRYQAALYLDGIIPGIQTASIERDGGFWTWLTVFYFDQLAPSINGRRKIGHMARYVPSFSNFRTYYRHLLLGPWLVYRAHGDTPALTKVVLSGTVDTPGELAEQLSARQEIITNPTILAVAKKLYLNESDKPKRGAGGSGAGSPRRFVTVLQQLDKTYDFFTMRADSLLSLLPNEFNRFRTELE